MTIHDTIWLSTSRFARQGKLAGKRALMHWYYRFVPRLAAHRAAAIITVSDASKKRSFSSSTYRQIGFLSPMKQLAGYISR